MLPLRALQDLRDLTFPSLDYFHHDDVDDKPEEELDQRLHCQLPVSVGRAHIVENVPSRLDVFARSFPVL